MSDPLSSLNQQIEQRRREIDRRLVELGFSMPLRSKVDSGYTGGNPATKRVGESAAATDETHLVVMPYGVSPVRAGDDVIEIPMGAGKIVARFASLPPGKRTVAQWRLPREYPETETTISFSANHARRFPCPSNLRVNKIVIDVTTAQSGAHVVVNLYSDDTASLILTSGNIDVSSTGRKTATLGSAVEIMATEWYVVELTADNTAVALRATALSANAAAFDNEAITIRSNSHAMSSPVNTAGFPWVSFVEA